MSFYLYSPYIKVISYFLNQLGHFGCLISLTAPYHYMFKVLWYLVNNFSPFTSRRYSVTFLISWVSYFLCSHPWKINPTFLIGLEAGSVSLNSFMDLGLSQMNCFSLIQLEQSIYYVEKCHLCGRRNTMQTEEMLLLFKMNGWLLVDDKSTVTLKLLVNCLL